MIIKTNLNRLNHFHDNVNMIPVEKQIMDFIIETKIFDKIQYRTNNRFMGYIVDDKAVLGLNFDCYEFRIEFRGDKFNLYPHNNSFSGIVFKSDFKKDIKNEFIKYLKTVAEVIEKTKEAQKIADEILILNNKNDYEKNITNALDKYFSNDIIKARYSIFDTNLIPKLDNRYTPGVWSWLNFDIKGTKQRHSKYEKGVGVELYMDGTIKNPRIDEFIKAIQCDENESTCKPSIKEMQAKLKYISKFEEKMKKFNGRTIPYLKDFLAVEQKGYEFRKSLKFTH